VFKMSNKNKCAICVEIKEIYFPDVSCWDMDCLFDHELKQLTLDDFNKKKIP